MEDFGRYLQSVAERDIDLLLMEEFHVDPQFVQWFAGRVGIEPPFSFDGAWHSLADEHGETDLLLRVQLASGRVAILIENKVGAPAQFEQDLRYHLRGLRSQEAGRFDRYITAICAPEVYLQALPIDTAYEHKISYEAVRDWFAKSDNARAQWRRAIFDEAIDQGRRGYTMKVHTGKTAFHSDYWLLIQRRYPQFIMAKPGPKGPKSDWIRYKATDFPKGVTLNHKNDQGCVDLEFERTSASDLAKLRSDNWPSEVRVVQRGKSAALSLPIAKCDMARPLTEQQDLVEAALNSAVVLIPFGTLMASVRRS